MSEERKTIYLCLAQWVRTEWNRSMWRKPSTRTGVLLVSSEEWGMSSVVQEKSEEFALRIIKLYQYMTTREQNREYVLSKQLLRSGTSIGANIAEAEFGISKDDFKAKMYIALKECNESRYWLRLLNRASYLSNEEFDSIYNDSDEILKLLFLSLEL